MKKNNKIVRYPKTLNINIGVIFFALIFIYLLFNVYIYLTAKHVSYYEVDENRVLNVYNDCDTALFSANMSDIMYIMECNPDTVA